MVRYGYITRTKIVKAECPEEDKIGSYIWILGKIKHAEYVRKDHPDAEEYFRIWVENEAYEKLPYLMTEKEAWDYFDEHIKQNYVK